jgi:AI-2 transport protein TqsA
MQKLKGRIDMAPNEPDLERPSIFKPILIVAAAAVLLIAMHFASSLLLPIMLSCFFAVLLTPIYNWLKLRRMPGGLPLLLSIGVLALVGLLLVLLIGNSLTVLAESLAGYSDQLAQRQAELEATAGQMTSNSSVKELISTLDPATLVNLLGFIVGAAASMFRSGIVILFITTFTLAEGSRFRERMVNAYGVDHFLTRNISALLKSIIDYFGLRALVNLVVAIATGIMLWLFGIEYAGLWAVMTFFFSFVPYIGAAVAMTPPVIIAYAQGGLGFAVIIIILAVVINALCENILAPMVMGKGLSISPTVVFLSFMFWMFILGGGGAFIAMPLTVAIILFMKSFKETHGLAAMMGNTPTPE